jgi:hypothetical protein
MSTLSSASTDAQLWASYDTNVSYEEDQSVAKAQAFITAAGMILRRRPQQMGVGGQSISFESIRDELKHARRWLAARRGSGVIFQDFSGIRD